MRFQPTATSEYALRAMVELASVDTPVKGHELHERQGIPPKYVENVMALLRRAGLVVSRRGNRGGYRLAHAASDITLAQVVAAVEQIGRPAWTDDGGEPDERAARFASTWEEVAEATFDAMSSLTLAEIVDRTCSRG